MNGERAAEVPRARPLSGGLWALFSWLRREDHSSTDSLSSVGTARTATSFAFVLPTLNNRPKSCYISSSSPSSDTYRKRLRDRSLRRQYDRDLTLHRKYGLYRDNHYDVLSLPPVLRGDHHNREEREFRAHSECYQQRRVAYVPGKRRAPQPPVHRPNTIPQRHSRKRPAPQPPIKNTVIKENSEHSTILKQLNKSNETIPFIDAVTGLVKQNNQSKFEGNREKTKQEKGFLKQLFESKKRYSTLDLAPAKILPNISELDKQATEIIEACKLKQSDNSNNCENIAMFSKGDTWFCTKCLRKFNSTVVTCTYCLPLKKNNNSIALKDIADNQPHNTYTQTEQETSSSNKSKIDKMGMDIREKQKLKEMLKEMKKSLPKKTKQDDLLHYTEIKNGNENGYSEITVDTPTLKISSSSHEKKRFELPSYSKQQLPVKSDKQNGLYDFKKELNSGRVLISQPVVLVAPDFKEIAIDKKINGCKSKFPQCGPVIQEDNKKTKITNTKNERIFEPLKISSLLNPVYIPNNDGLNQEKHIKSPIKIINEVQSYKSNSNQTITQPDTNKNVDTPKSNKKELIASYDVKHNILEVKPMIPEPIKESIELTTVSPNTEDSKYAGNNIILTVEQHSRRRDLINKLEQSIAKGDERAAAEAAIQLAQLRLNCSVLSFSSQLAGSSKTTPTENKSAIQNRSNASAVTKFDTKTQTNKIDLLKKQSTNKCTESLKIPTRTEKKDTTNEDQNIKENYMKILPEPSSSSEKSVDQTNMVPIEVWVEDKEATRGPISLHISRAAVVGDLRHRADLILGVAPQLQRWIVGRTLCTDETTSLSALAGPNLSAPFYLCLVEADKGATQVDVSASKAESQTKGEVYTELMQLEQKALIRNTEPFECGVCMENCVSGEGAVIRECVHEFCRQCLQDLIRHSEEPVVTCPAMGCHGSLQEREIRALVSPDDYERWLARGLAAAESGTRNSFHCRTSDCAGWALCEPGVRRFPCPVCGKTNCVPCQAIHEGVTCKKYQTKLQESKILFDTNQADEGTQALLNSMIAKGEALQCPECNAVITKKWGCDWVKCSACKTEICWVTRGRRWGPSGRGDISSGCRCGVDGKKCHPSCGYCH